jgi:hypothetical protein
MNIQHIFDAFASAFERKIDKDYFIVLQFEISDHPGTVWQIEVKNGYT